MTCSNMDGKIYTPLSPLLLPPMICDLCVLKISGFDTQENSECLQYNAERVGAGKELSAKQT